MPKFEVIFAQDVPHYGVVEIQARNRKSAIAKAKHHWRLVQRGQKNHGHARTLNLATPSTHASS